MPRSQLPGRPRIASCSSRRAVDADRGHQAADAALQDALDQRDRAVAEPAGGRKIQQVQRAVALDDRRDEIFEVAAHEQLAAGEVHPAELGPLAEERSTSAGVISPTLFFCQMLHISQRKLQW